MSESIILAGVNGRLILEVSDYERPTASDEYDANWVMAHVSIQSGPFSGSFRASFSTHDFARLEREFSDAVKTLAGSIEFESAEGDLSFSIKLSNRGSADVAGSAKPNTWPGSTLSFAFETDQTVLAEAVRQLTRVIRRLPVKETK
jgi:hypothetical protein